MTLALSSELKASRTRLLQYISMAKAQLLRAYVSRDRRRIVKAKLTLARHLRELAESPELGPQPLFHPGQVFYYLLDAGADINLSSSELKQARGRYIPTAILLEKETSHARMCTSLED